MDLIGVRNPDALAKLPEAEQKEWRALWAGVDALLKKTETRSLWTDVDALLKKAGVALP